jgi:hypothetical protein
MNLLSKTFAPRLLAGLGTAALVAGVGLFASSRPAHTAGGPIAVNVANLPLPTLPADLVAPTQPFQMDLQPLSSTSSRASQNFTVPAHKRLVIEFVSAEVNEYPSGSGAYTYLETTAGGQDVTYYLANTYESSARKTQVVRIYADPGTTVTVGANSYGGNGVGTDTEISGYYVNVP